MATPDRKVAACRGKGRRARALWAQGEQYARGLFRAGINFGSGLFLMTSKYLLSAAGIALIAATGAAQAADISPTVAVMDPGPVPTGPVVTIEIEKWLSMYYEPGNDPDFEADLDFDIDILTASGWGFELYGDAGVEIESPLNGGYDITGPSTGSSATSNSAFSPASAAPFPSATALATASGSTSATRPTR